MTRISKFILVPLVLFSLIIGIQQISSNNQVFAKSLAYCCNTGACDGEPCSSPSSISRLYGQEVCHDYIITCLACSEFEPEPEGTPCRILYQNNCY